MTAAAPLETTTRTPTPSTSFPATHPWGHTWFTLLRSPWTSLVLVPARAGASALFAAEALAEIGRRHQREPIQVINAEQISSGDLRTVLNTIVQLSGSTTRLLIAVSSPLTHDAAIPAARAADAAVLLVGVGRTPVADARRTIDAIGAQTFIGAIAVRP